MSKPRALVTAPLRGPGLDRLRDVADVEFDPWIEHQPIRLLGADDLAARLAEMSADLLVCEADECKGPVFEQPLRAVASTRGDPTNVDVAGATAAGIPVLHAPGRNADGVAEMAVALMFAVNRRVILGDRDMRAGTVFTDTIPYQRYRAWQMAGRTVGLVGLGAVGRAAKWRFEGLGMKVIAHDPYQPDADCELDELLANADVVSMHAPVLPDTEGMIGADQFAAMRRGSIYLNTARAALHDTEALVEALASGQLGGAGLDHVQGEILPDGHPLAALDNVVLTPHIGGATYDTEVNQTDMVVEDICRLLAGERPHRLANPEVWR
ncbi:MAG: 3-phosphoglycerate dehydrogenase [Acidimicrobiia bacterium]|nr:3-phosphoglycerate dehydrogenase [Acidimicrobiia bacterium]MYE73627.1 3-phosphoglycerate dehydrogenase [Acidimicrobiia bacterium]MYE73977.1 3-phosphoglycerate dehydrogenase [Acidimicrobiia bacterium]MYJ60763.1 3-phosphoglycerate dehydrogenase [Acidimicrobiia bacterium]